MSGWKHEGGRRQRWAGWTLAGLVALLPWLGCGDSGGDSNGGDTGPREGYPAGPYGTAEGEIIADLSFAKPDGAPLSLSDVYADGSNRLMLISTASGWCTSCVEEQRDLQDLYERYASRGLYVMVSVFEDADFRAADTAYVADWVDRYDVTYQVVLDEAFQLQAYYNRTLTPMVMLVDVASMKMLRISTGWDASAVEAIVEARL